MNYFEYVFSNLTYVLIFFGAIIIVVAAAFLAPYVRKLLKMKDKNTEKVSDVGEKPKDSSDSPEKPDGGKNS